jgi:hypothetical protein
LAVVPTTSATAELAATAADYQRQIAEAASGRD